MALILYFILLIFNKLFENVCVCVCECVSVSGADSGTHVVMQRLEKDTRFSVPYSKTCYFEAKSLSEFAT